jgi:type I restriction enzyme R subunit
VDDFPSEEEEMAFVQAFRKLMRVKNVLGSFTDFTWAGPANGRADYLRITRANTWTCTIRCEVTHQKEKASILEDMDFELELIHRDEINVAYILKLLAKLKAG